MSDLFKVGDVPMKFMSIKEFCKEVGITPQHFKRLEEAGKAPRFIHLGLSKKMRKCVRITRPDALRWVQEFTNSKEAE